MAEIQQFELNFTKSSQARNVGMLMAEYGAGHEWSEAAYQKLKEFVKCTFKSQFLAEEIRVWCYENGLARPKNDRAFGGVITRASKDGIIQFVGYEQTQNPKAHRAIAAVWKKGMQ